MGRRPLDGSGRILAEMFATDEDDLLICDPDSAAKIGWFQLIYGNSGYDVVSDFSDNDICNVIWNMVISPLARPAGA